MTQQIQLANLNSGPQTNPDELDGSAGKGLFSFFYKGVVTTVFFKADTAMNVTFLCVLPDPSGGSSNVYTWQTFTSVTFASYDGRLPLPQGAQLQVVTNNVVGANPSTTIVYDEVGQT